MKIETNENGNTVLKAEDGGALCPCDQSGPTTTSIVYLAKGDSTSSWKDCAYGTNDEIRYSVRSIIRELKAIGKFAAVRTLLEVANYDWDFIGSNYLSSTDSDFQTMMAAIVSQGVMTQAELDALLQKCYWSEN